MPLRITTWNVNGIRNPFGYQPWSSNRTFGAMFDILDADIIVMQELKIQRKDLQDDMVIVPGWDCFFSLPKHKKGYSGVAIYTKESVCAPIRAEEGILGVLCPPGSSTAYRDSPSEATIGGYPSLEQTENFKTDSLSLDSEGRCVVLEFPAFVLFGVYSPANSNGLRDDFRYAFLSALDIRVRNLERSGKRVIIAGDLNVLRAEIDSAHAEETLRKGVLNHEEFISTPNRRIFNQLLEDGEVIGERDKDREEPVLWDICRGFHPTRKGMYTQWEQKINARPGNFGSRIDFILCSRDMKSWFLSADIQEGLMGSDHCPVYADLHDKIMLGDNVIDCQDIMNPVGTFLYGTRVISPSTREPLLLSGKRLPEFDTTKRRSIKDMFQKNSKFSPLSSDENTTTGIEMSDSNWNASLKNVAKHYKRKRSVKLMVEGNSKSRLSYTASRPGDQKSLEDFFSRRVNKTARKPLVQPVLTNKFTTLCDSVIASELCSKDFHYTNPDEYGIPSTTKPEMSNPFNLSIDHAISNTRSTAHGSTEKPSSSFLEQDVSLAGHAQSSFSWSNLLRKPAPPRCQGHHEPCIMLATKKSGVNCGRRFWICARPVGPSGIRESGSEWRCSAFLWASDWK
ncbi:DNase I-like protein [Patellaria atrata CBS 101060]|uniref:DNA-(apurinic or apyrimidinic site) endonuclease 2 n=1 Tax=Patellaria atrata CBS 101060 TaxID=1346257 RepID=A0A9P4VLL0_9PEZI|nr:DNase I-like protein [Patellaria atrata CBS 101060]